MLNRLTLSILLLWCLAPGSLFALDFNIINPGFELTPPMVIEPIIPHFDFVVTTCTPTEITSNHSASSLPSLHNGELVWSEADPSGGTRLYLKNLRNQPSTAPIAIDSSGWFLDAPSLYNGQVAYESTDHLVVHNIRIYDGTSNSAVTTGSSTTAFSEPSLYADSIAYTRKISGEYEILYQSGLSVQQISNGSTTFNQSPSLYAGTIAWAGYDGHDFEIYYWNGTTIQQLTNNNFDDRSPSLYNGTIAWNGGDTGDTREIYYWNGTTIQQLTNNDFNDVNPSLYNGNVAWTSYDGNDYEIYYWDGSTTQQVTNNSVDDYGVSLDNGAIAWIHSVSGSNGGHDISYCEVDPPQKPSLADQGTTNITVNTAQLNAMVNPNGQETTYKFEYGTSSSYGSETTTLSLNAGSVGVMVDATLSNLQPNTTYHYHTVATNIAGTTNDADHTFTTLPESAVLATVTTGSAHGGADSTVVTITATINPNGFETSYQFEYGTDTSYGHQTQLSSAGGGRDAVTASSTIDGLETMTTYHYRIVATNDAGSVYGADQSFTTMAEILPTMALPSGQHHYPYLPVTMPVKDLDPSVAQPLSVGNVLGGTLNLRVGLMASDHPVDVYLGVQASVLGSDILLIDSSATLQPFSTGLVPWKSTVSNGVDNESVFGDIDVTTLPSDTYTLYVMVVPAGETNLANYSLWSTNIVINN